MWHFEIKKKYSPNNLVKIMLLNEHELNRRLLTMLAMKLAFFKFEKEGDFLFFFFKHKSTQNIMTSNIF